MAAAQSKKSKKQKKKELTYAPKTLEMALEHYEKEK